MPILKKSENTAAQWAASNPVLEDGELAFDENGQAKVGDGESRYSDLGYWNPGSPFAQNTTLDPPPIDTLDAVGVFRLANAASEIESGNNYQYGALLDMRYGNVQTAWPYPVFYLQNIAKDGSTYGVSGMQVLSSWESDQVTGAYAIAGSFSFTLNAPSNTGRMHDCHGLSGSVQIWKGYAYSNATAVSANLDVRTPGNGKMYGLYVSTYLPVAAGCTELHAIGIRDQDTTGTASTGKKYALSVVDAGYSDLAFLTLDGKTLKLTQDTPASAAATGTIGSIRVDADYIYVCTATNTWKRAALATW